jgi:Ni/Co efflux regulator RcnB
MKTKRNLVIVFAVAAMMQPFLSEAQTVARKESPVAKHNEEKAGWQPAKIDDKGGNVQGGVEFYSQDAECMTGKVKLLKLVNTNNYATRVSYQQSADSPVVNIAVAASTTLEGICGTADGNLAKLVMNPPVGLSKEQKQKNKEYLQTHIVVSKVK